MEAVEDIPVVTFPGPAAFVKGELEQREHGVVDLVVVEIHEVMVGRRTFPCEREAGAGIAGP